MAKNTPTLKNIALIIILIAVAVSWRVINHDLHIAPNLEIVTAVSVLAAVAIGFRAAVLVPISTMIVSDLILGNSSIFIATWSSFAIIGASAVLLRKLNQKPKSQILYSVGFAAVSSFFFFIVTNFGVWAQGWYPATLAGLMDSYVMAIPFYRTMLIGNLILVPATIAVWQLVRAQQTAKNLVVDSSVR